MSRPDTYEDALGRRRKENDELQFPQSTSYGRQLSTFPDYSPIFPDFHDPQLTYRRGSYDRIRSGPQSRSQHGHNPAAFRSSSPPWRQSLATFWNGDFQWTVQKLAFNLVVAWEKMWEYLSSAGLLQLIPFGLTSILTICGIWPHTQLWFIFCVLIPGLIPNTVWLLQQSVELWRGPNPNQTDDMGLVGWQVGWQMVMLVGGGVWFWCKQYEMRRRMVVRNREASRFSSLGVGCQPVKCPGHKLVFCPRGDCMEYHGGWKRASLWMRDVGGVWKEE